MNKLTNIKKLILPKTQIESVYQHLRQAGNKGVEGVALWVGVYNSETEFEIKATIIPAQKAYSLESGLLYAVGEEELHRINVWLYESKMTLIGQIHSHPNEAYHSEMDDAYPIMAKMGGISIVVPDFAFRPFRLGDWAVYRLHPQNGWVELNSSEVDLLINIVE